MVKAAPKIQGVIDRISHIDVIVRPIELQGIGRGILISPPANGEGLTGRPHFAAVGLGDQHIFGRALGCLRRVSIGTQVDVAAVGSRFVGVILSAALPRSIAGDWAASTRECSRGELPANQLRHSTPGPMHRRESCRKDSVRGNRRRVPSLRAETQPSRLSAPSGSTNCGSCARLFESVKAAFCQAISVGRGTPCQSAVCPVPEV